MEDEGPGIPLEQREQVFERFWQADSARSDRSNTGLGLAMARAIAESHGGQLLAQASSGGHGGCRMLLRLPLQR
jgi:signal transduction histidine kinase